MKGIRIGLGMGDGRRRERRRARRALPARRGGRLRDPLVRQHLRLRRHDPRRPGRARDPERRDRHRRRPHALAPPRLHGAAGALDAGGRARALRAGPGPQPPARDREPARALLRAPGATHARVCDRGEAAARHREDELPGNPVPRERLALGEDRRALPGADRRSRPAACAGSRASSRTGRSPG